MNKVLDITYTLTEAHKLNERDDSYCVADRFKGGYEALVAAAKAPTPEEAEKILRVAYRGPDVCGVEVRWTINSPRSSTATPSA